MKGKKTYIAGLLVSIFGVLQMSPDFASLVGDHAGTVNAILGVLVLIARSMAEQKQA